MQDRRAHRVHRHTDGPRAVHLQAYVPRRGRAAVPRADRHAPPLGPSPVREGQVQGLREGDSR